MTTSDEIAAIRRRLAAATSTDWQRLQHYNEAQEEFHQHAAADMATLLAALDAAQAALREIAAHQPYPADIWTPLTTDEQRTLNDAMRATTVRHPLDRLYAGWARRVLAQTATLAMRALEEATNE